MSHNLEFLGNGVFPQLLKAPLLLTAAVGIGPTTADNAYDVPALNQYLDFINLMTYDMPNA